MDQKENISTTAPGHRALTLFKEIFWPPIAPVGLAASKESRLYWIILCSLSVIPLTAILHHALFYSHTCILDPFGPEYTPAVVHKWLSRDPSLPWSICIMAFAFYIGSHYPWFKILVSPAFVSFLPLSLWVWDIPYTERYICRHFHGGRLKIFGDIPLTRRYFYIFGLLVYLVFVIYLLRKHRLKR
jgi:hypothetical protein